jgi:hypothetical protein
VGVGVGTYWFDGTVGIRTGLGCAPGVDASALWGDIRGTTVTTGIDGAAAFPEGGIRNV